MSTQQPAMQSQHTRQRIARADQRGFSDCAVRSWKRAETSRNHQRPAQEGQAAAAKKRSGSQRGPGGQLHPRGKDRRTGGTELRVRLRGRTEAFQQLSHDIAMHIAALDPRYVRREKSTRNARKRTRLLQGATLATGKPERSSRKSSTEKWKVLRRNCLYEQHTSRMRA